MSKKSRDQMVDVLIQEILEKNKDLFEDLARIEEAEKVGEHLDPDTQWIQGVGEE